MTDVLGNDSTVVWAGVLDGRGLAKSFSEETTDAQGNLTVKSQHDVTYDAEGRSDKFSQTVTDPLGVVTKTYRHGTDYSPLGFQDGLDETVDSTDKAGVRTFSTVHQGPSQYDALGHLVQRHDESLTSVYDKANEFATGNEKRRGLVGDLLQWIGPRGGLHEDRRAHLSRRFAEPKNRYDLLQWKIQHRWTSCVQPHERRQRRFQRGTFHLALQLGRYGPETGTAFGMVTKSDVRGEWGK
jgi:hypothetical protein